MITGAIAVLIGIVVLPSAAGEGKWDVFWVWLGIAVFVLIFGMISRQQDRAENNFTAYWADGQLPDWKRKQVNLWEKDTGGLSTKSPTAGRTRMKCAGCGHRVREVSRPKYGNASFILYECEKCGERKLVKMD